MEHPHARGGRIITDDPARLFKALPRFSRHQGLRYGMLLRPGEALQARERLLNSCFTLGVRLNAGEKQALYKIFYNNLRHDLSPTAFGRAMWKLTKKASTLVQDHFGVALNLRKLKQPGSGIHAVIRAEQAPNPDSRVTVNPEARDALGMARLTLDWQFSAIDKHSVTGMMAGLDAELKRLGLGRVEPADWLADRDRLWQFDPLISNHPIGGYHHMGTTRMADNPRQGVVDADGKVHGIDNLYIAGSSVFPTVGWANPTLTILALSLRLAERLKSAASLH